MNSDCYEKGHTPDGVGFCAKCEQEIFRVVINTPEWDRVVYHTQAELDRLWKGVDRQAASDVGGRHGG